MGSCPEGAISKDLETGVVQIDKETCNGCKAAAGRFGTEKVKTSPCKVDCPAHINVQGYISLAAQGKFQEALGLIKQENPFPAICGRVCHYPCESACLRGEIDEPVAINAIKRFVADLDLDASTRYVPEIKEKKEDKVAIIGAGPAGLTGAYYLARKGYQVTVFEKLPVAGGMMAVGIPQYRLPKDILAAEIQAIQDMGVEIKTGVTFGKDITLSNLKGDDYGAVFSATGLHLGQALDVGGEDLPGVLNGIGFLKESALENRVSVGENVIVIGGGNAAIDAALTAKRLGAKEVSVVCLEEREEMPAWEHEIADALEEGITITNSLGPKRFLEKEGKLSGIEFKRCTALFDEKGAFNPQYDEMDLTTFETETAIVAVGQAGDRSLADPVTLQTQTEWVFAGGDALYGPKSVVEAIACGKEAAISIDRYLRGVDLREDREKEWRAVADVYKEEYDPAKRAQTPRLKPELRLNNFNEVEQGLSEEMVVQEAKRCLNCGCACMQSCPFDVIQFDGEVGVSHKCDLCFDRTYGGASPVCAEVCLTDALTFGEYDLIKQDALDEGRTIVEDLSRASHLYVK
jgi:NADPH-dependent glutamate synthase beta subunit-like oxidoreductase